MDSNSLEIYSFLDSLDLPKPCPDAQSSLEQPLSLEEIVSAIKLSQTGRAPGPDSFHMEFYKEFSSKLTPILKSVYDESGYWKSAADAYPGHDFSLTKER